MNSDLLFGVSFVMVVFAAFLVGLHIDATLWLVSIFLLIVFVPLMFYSALKDYRKT